MTVRLLSMFWLVAVWVALWESLSVANVLSGIAVAGLLLIVFPPSESSALTGPLRPIAALHFLGYFIWKLFEANLVVAWEVLTPNNESVNEGIVAVPLTGASDTIVTIVANAVSLTPGTLTLEVERNPTVLYIHILHLRSIAQARLDVLHLERLALKAMGTDAAIAEVEQRFADEERGQASTATTGEST